MCAEERMLADAGMLARISMARAEYSKAERVLLRVLRFAPNSRELRLLLAEVLLVTRGPEAAIGEYQRLVERDSQDLEALYRISIAYGSMGEKKLADEWRDRADHAKEGNEAAYYSLASPFRRDGHIAYSYYVLNRVIEGPPHGSRYDVNACSLFESYRRSDRDLSGLAEVYRRHYLALLATSSSRSRGGVEGTKAAWHAMRAVELEDADKHDEAVSQLTEASASCGSNPWAYIELADILFRVGFYRSARGAYGLALEWHKLAPPEDWRSTVADLARERLDDIEAMVKWQKPKKHLNAQELKGFLAKLGRVSWVARDACAPGLQWGAVQGSFLFLDDARSTVVRCFDEVAESVGLENLDATCIAFTPEAVWVGTPAGLLSYDRSADVWTQIVIGDDIVDARVVSLKTGDAGMLVVAIAGDGAKQRIFAFDTDKQVWSEKK